MEQADRSLRWSLDHDSTGGAVPGYRPHALLAACVVAPVLGLIAGLLAVGGDVAIAQGLAQWRTWPLPAVLLAGALVAAVRETSRWRRNLELAGREHRFLTYQVRRASLATTLTRHGEGALQQLADCLASIDSATGWIDANASDDAGADLQEHLAQVRSAVQRGQRAVTTLQGLTRPQQEATLIQDIDLADLLDDLVNLLEWECYLHRIEIRRRYGDRVGRLRGDRLRLRQVCQHLLINALEAVDRDGWILVEATGTEHEVTLRVADSGPGIRVADPAVIFEALYTTRTDHVGLGLSVSRQLAREMRGSLTLTEPNDAGACFVLTLPRRIGAAAATRPDPDARR